MKSVSNCSSTIYQAWTLNETLNQGDLSIAWSWATSAPFLFTPQAQRIDFRRVIISWWYSPALAQNALFSASCILTSRKCGIMDLSDMSNGNQPIPFLRKSHTALFRSILSAPRLERDQMLLGGRVSWVSRCVILELAKNQVEGHDYIIFMYTQRLCILWIYLTNCS